MQNEVLSIEQGRIVDHVDRNGLNNRKANLRPATRSQNRFNQKRRRDNSSGFKGVRLSRSAQRWRASIRAEGRIYYLGGFATPIEAARAYNAAALRLHGPFALLNPVD
jgi:hypothetical protein